MSRKSASKTFGESSLAMTGLVLAGALLLLMAIAGWWSGKTQQSAASDARTEQIRTAALLGQAMSERLLAEGDLSIVRQWISELGHRHNLTTCRLTLPTGELLADLDPSQVDLLDWPDTWPEGEEPSEGTEVLTDTTIVITSNVRVGDRGSAALVMGASIVAPTPLLETTQTGIGVFGSIALILLLLAYRRARSSMHAVTLLRNALISFKPGEDDESTVMLDERSGREAVAWNRLLRNHATLRQAIVADTASREIGLQSQRDTELTSAFDALWTGIVILDANGCIKYSNGAASMLLSVSRESLIGQPAHEILPPEVREAFDRMNQDHDLAEPSIEVEKNNGETIDVLRYTIRRARRAMREHLMVMIEDITQLQCANNARNSFISQATHELRTPLTNIRMYAEMAIDDGDRDPAVRAKCLNVINQEAGRLERIVSDMLSVVEIEAGSISLASNDIHISELLDDLKRDYDAQADERSIAMEFDLSPKLPIIRGDRDKLALVLHNLLGNALKYTGDSGSVQVRADSEDDELTIEVIDSGVGISEEDQSHVFEKFYRSTDSRVQETTGTGLGLALALEIVRLHGGVIDVDSQLDHGSTFTVKLPIRRMAA